MKEFNSDTYIAESKTRFLSKTIVRESTGCWEWTAFRIVLKSGGPYGRFSFQGVTDYAHRVAYKLFVGPIADSFVIDHLCRNTLCVNPEHLEAVPQAVNLQRAPKHIIHGDGANLLGRPKKVRP